jgi:hypothetical protein
MGDFVACQEGWNRAPRAGSDGAARGADANGDRPDRSSPRGETLEGVRPLSLTAQVHLPPAHAKDVRGHAFILSTGPRSPLGIAETWLAPPPIWRCARFE